MMYTLLPERPVQFGEDGKFVASFNENCFDITLTVVDGKEGNKQLALDVSPQEAGGYEIVVSFVVVVNGVEHWVDFDLWKTAETVWKADVQTAAISVGFRFEVHDVLAPSDLRTGGGFRKLPHSRAYFVNTTELNNLGGSLFASWHRRELEGESAVAVTELHEDELDALLKACCAYSTVVITKRNFEVLLPIAWKFKIVGVLRAIERFLSNSKGDPRDLQSWTSPTASNSPSWPPTSSGRWAGRSSGGRR
ncbi:hypothetical protein M3Y99_00093800 [Aphelenchoides fujianensis]|nr:hypothetical protein M3Y99_00093800 [Aphelenchoides fujianensis]